MAYLKPPWFVRKIFNKVAMATGVGNSQTLTVTKRVSKQPQQIPVVVPEVGGVKYLVSTRGEAEWVRNVLANGGAVVEMGGAAFITTCPAVLPSAEVLDTLPPRQRRAITMFAVASCLRLDIVAT